MEFEDEIEEEAWEIERLGVQFKRLTQAVKTTTSPNYYLKPITDQILSHVCLNFKTQGLKQQETLNGLPKGIRLSIAQCLFFPIIQNAHLFHGVSHDFLFQLVPEMEAEYFPPKEDVILQNEAPTDLYILVSGAVVLGKAIAGDMFGEIGMSRITLMNIIQENKEDGDIIMNNLFKKLTGMESIGFVNQRTDLDLNPDNRGTERGNFSHIVCEEHLHGGDSLKQDTRAIDSFLNSDVSAGKKNEETGGEMRNFSGQEGGMIAVNSTAGRRNDCSESNCSNSSQSQLRDVLTTFGTGHSSGPTDREVASKLTKRVTIHMKFLHEKNTSLKQLAKLIILPDSLEELLRIAVALGGTAGEKFGGYKLTKIVNEENAEIDDLRVIRDGDHLFLLQNV
ncbi:unnamed protein product [Camellia sinensis]